MMCIEEIIKALETEVLCENCPHNGSDCDGRGCYYIEAAETIKELKARAEKAEAEVARLIELLQKTQQAEGETE